MELGTNDLHMELDGAARTLKLFDVGGGLVFHCETRNRTTANGQYGHDGNCPPGEFLLGLPAAKGTVPFGPFFIPVLDYDDHHAMRAHGRSGIGLHGGGTGLANPFADRQGWQVTHGCWRLQNEDLREVVRRVNACQQGGGQVFVTVAAGAPGAGALDGDWGPTVELFPDE